MARPGDEVVVAPGTYNLTAQLNVGQDLYIHGQDGQPLPRVVSTAPIVFSISKYAGGARLSSLQLEAPGVVVETTFLLSGGIATMDHLVVLGEAAAGGNAVSLSGGWTLRDSVVHTQATGGVALETQEGVTHVVNVTAVASDAGGTGLLSDSHVGTTASVRLSAWRVTL